MKKLSVFLFTVALLYCNAQVNPMLIDTTEEKMADSSLLDSIDTNTVIFEYIDTGLSVERYQSRIAWFIEKDQPEKAYAECDIAAKKKNSPDFLYLKGQLMMDEFVYGKPDSAFDFHNLNEDINDRDTSLNPPLKLPLKFTERIVEIWQEVLDSTPEDFNVEFNIAHLYSISGGTQMVKDLLPKLYKNAPIPLQKELMNMMGTLAKNFRERGMFSESIEVYKVIQKLYNKNPQVLADIAGEFYLNGNMDTALYYINRCMKKNGLTQESLENAFILYSMSELYDSAENVLRIISEANQTEHHNFYKAVVHFSQEKESWINQMKIYLFDYSEKNDPTVNICNYMLSKEFQRTFQDYKKIISYDLHDGIKFLLVKKFIKDFPTQFYFRQILIDLYTEHHFYKEAIKCYENINIEGIGLTQGEKDQFKFKYAYALYMNDQKKKASEIYNEGGMSALKAHLGEAHDKLHQRGEKLSELNDKSDRLKNSANEFAKLAQQLNKDRTNSWW